MFTLPPQAQHSPNELLTREKKKQNMQAFTYNTIQIFLSVIWLFLLIPGKNSYYLCADHASGIPLIPQIALPS